MVLLAELTRCCTGIQPMEETSPGLRFGASKTVEECYNAPINDLGLVICLGIVGSAYLEGGTLTLEEGLTEVARKNLIYVKNDGF